VFISFITLNTKNLQLLTTVDKQELHMYVDDRNKKYRSILSIGNQHVLKKRKHLHQEFIKHINTNALLGLDGNVI